MRKIHLRDVILGGQDGLVNVLGLTLGLFAAHASARVILVAGLAAGFSEAISMGGVAYTSALADKARVRSSTKSQIVFEAAVVGISAIVGAFIPIFPFIFFTTVSALVLAFVVSVAILFVIGIARGRTMNEVSPIHSGIQMAVIGVVSSIAGFVVGLLLKV